MHIHSRIQFENTQHFSITYTFSKKPPVPDWRSVAHSNQILFSKLFVEKINQASFDSWRCIYIRSLYTRIVGALCSRYPLKKGRNDATQNACWANEMHRIISEQKRKVNHSRITICIRRVSESSRCKMSSCLFWFGYVVLCRVKTRRRDVSVGWDFGFT